MGRGGADVSGANDADFCTSHCSSPFQIFRGRDYELVARVFNPCYNDAYVTFSESADITLCLLTPRRLAHGESLASTDRKLPHSSFSGSSLARRDKRQAAS